MKQKINLVNLIDKIKFTSATKIIVLENITKFNLHHQLK